MVMLEVKSEMLPTTLLEKLWTPVTTDPAKAEPGRVGIEGPARPVDGAETGLAVVTVPLP